MFYYLNFNLISDNLQLCMEALKELRQDFKKVLQLYDQVSVTTIKPLYIYNNSVFARTKH